MFQGVGMEEMLVESHDILETSPYRHMSLETRLVVRRLTP